MPNTIVCIGDSITYGWWSASSYLSQTFPARLALRYPALRVVNLGVNGDSAVNIEATRLPEIDTYSPFRVIVWAGINDIDGYSETTVQTALEGIYSYCAGKGYEVWAITITPRNDSSGAVNTARTNLNSWINGVPTNVTTVIDAWTAVRDPGDTTQILPAYAEGVNHINDAGMSVIIPLFPSL